VAYEKCETYLHFTMYITNHYQKNKDTVKYRSYNPDFFPPWYDRTLVGLGLLITEASRSHSDTYPTLGRGPLEE
jgi:hypothetical protein